MEHLCFISDFPSTDEEKYYKHIRTIFETYTIYVGGNYIFIKNDKGKTARFASQELNPDRIKEEQIIKWLEKLRNLYPGF